MSIVEWMVWAVTETMKFFLISYGVLGFDQRKSPVRSLVFLYLFVGIPIMYHFGYDKIYYTSLWGIVFIHMFFQGGLLKKLQAILLQYIAITVVDTMLWSVLALLQNTVGLSESSMNMISEVAGTIFWLGIFYWVRKYRSQIRDGFFSLPFRYYLLITGILLGIGLNTANTLSIVRGEMTERMGRAAYLISNIVCILILIGCILLARLIYAGQQLKMERKYSRTYFEAHREYYQMMRERVQEIHRFRHDFRKHITALQALCREKQFGRIQNYVQELSGAVQETGSVYTGNEIVDCFVNELVSAFKGENDVSLEITGRFSEGLPLADSDICILFGNALDNAREALQQCEGSRRFEMVIRNYQDTLFVRICNTATSKQGSLLTSDKDDRDCHGYGTKNMRYVVEKYDGNIRWDYGDGMLAVEIELHK